MGEKQAAEIGHVVQGMVRLAEGFGFALPWANLLDACDGVVSRETLHAATLDLIDQGVLEAAPQGLRFALVAPSNPPAMPTPDGPQ